MSALWLTSSSCPSLWAACHWLLQTLVVVLKEELSPVLLREPGMVHFTGWMTSRLVEGRKLLAPGGVIQC